MHPAPYMAGALALGIAAAGWLRPHPLLCLPLLAITLAAALSGRRRWAPAALLLTVALLGSLLYSYAQTAGQGNLTAWLGQSVTLAGTVTGEPQTRESGVTSYIVAVEGVESHPASGAVYVTQRAGTPPGYGERVRVAGRLKRPIGARTPGGFDQAAYLGRQGVQVVLDTGKAERLGVGSLPLLQRWAVAARLRLERVLRESLAPREAALAAGLLYGSRSDLPDDIKESFRASGVFHLLAVSGGNLAMIIIPLLAILSRLGVGRRWASAAAIPMVIFFVFLTGASPSVVRAGTMAVLVLVGDLLRRERNAVNTLGASVFLLLLSRPQLLFDLGFQLSASATLGILLYARRLQGWLEPALARGIGGRSGKWAAAGLSVTLAAQVLVEPISLNAFGAFSAIAPIANLLVLAFLEPVVQIGMASSLIGLAALAVARILFWPVGLGLRLLVSLVKLTSAIPGAYLEVGRLPVLWVLLWYAVLALLSVPAWRAALIAGVRATAATWRREGRRARTGWAMLGALVLVTAFTWHRALADPADLLQIHFIDIGQGDAILIQAPGGKSMLVDTGPYVPPDPAHQRQEYDAGAEVILPFLAEHGVRRLDYLVLTHPDLDHIGGGLAILGALPVGAVLRSDQNPTEARYVATLQAAAVQGIPLLRPQAGNRFELGAEVGLQVLNPARERYTGTRSDDNSNCVALRLTYRQVAVLLTCDLEAIAEERLVRERWDLRADLLKVSHHGSGNSSTAGFLRAVQPKWAVISAGYGNSFRHPHPQALQRLEEVGAQIWRTDLQSTITARTDGFSMSVSGSRPAPVVGPDGPVGLLGRRWIGAW